MVFTKNFVLSVRNVGIIILLVILSSSCTSLSIQNDTFAPTQETSDISILVESIFTHFQNCELVYMEPQKDLSNSALETMQVSEPFWDFPFSKVNQDSAGIQSVSLGAANLTFPRHKDIHRYTHEHCSFAVLLLHEFNEEIEEWLVETLIPRYGPILRKDMDHFLFILPNEGIANQILLSPRFGSKIKYKLAVYQDGPPVGLTCKTVDFYGNGGHSKLTTLATFNKQELQSGQIETKNLFPDFTTYFHGKVFRFAIPKVAFRFEIEKRSDGRFHPKRGFYKWWMDEAMLKFNFTYDIFWASFGGGTGKRLENGTWVGATGDLFYGKADCSFIVGEIYSRHEFLGWSSSLSYEWVIFMTHSPRHSYSPKAIFKPFTPLMWSLFLLALVVMTLALKFLVLAQVDPNSEGIQWKSGKVFEYMFVTLMEQDQVNPLKSNSTRMLCAFWLLFAMVMATVYKGKLVSLIAFPVTTWVPSTFEELANSNFKVALNVVGKAGAAYVLIATSTSPVFKKLTARMELEPESENCLQRAMDEDLGCIIWKGIADYAMVKHLTDEDGRVPLQESSQIALFIGDGLVYERRAIFGQHLDLTIQTAMQMGLTIKWLQLDQEFIKNERKLYETSRNMTQVVYDYDDDGPKKLKMSQFSGLFMLCFLGYVISLGRKVFEIVDKSRTAKKQHRRVDDGQGTEFQKISARWSALHHILFI